MNYWLVKFAPFRVSWQDILRQGRFEIYGVRNFQAKNNLAKMKLGDWVLFYHSQEEKQIMGILQVSEEAHQDKTTAEKWLSVTFEPIKTLEKPISLSQIKYDAALQNIGLVKQQRLAVMPLAKTEFEKILEKGKSY
ncbi:EVE domain-containing protein [Kaistella sp. 97-N-M2]|uniref:EVE domain-containing protein n=1 Tax=Kaistella sp. 97-N-M2 TaxID=2908645 RepID=UPI001F31F4A4|nr:EVE domain-containing protein [Kaistella sp. 97-N-M2]UJF29570.1 EVE domain-containing protein [Kaistella sp. 97-N-M2]